MRKTDERLEYKGFIKVLLGVLVFFALAYVLTDRLVASKNNPTSDEEEEIVLHETLMGTMFNEEDMVYYVLLYSADDDQASAYERMQEEYNQAPTSRFKLYYVNMSLALNKKYLVEEGSNTKAKVLDDMKVKSGTLIKIENKEITEYYEGMTSINKIL